MEDIGLLNLDAGRVQLAATPDVYGVVEYILKQKELKRELMVIILWFIWSECNGIREEQRRRPAEIIVRSIELYAHENIQSRDMSPSLSLSGGQHKKKWSNRQTMFLS